MSADELSSSDITEQLQNWNERRNGEAEDALLGLVYTELRRQAHRYLKKERSGHILQTTGLVHEAYIKLSQQKSVVWENRAHFFGVAATLMRRILIDYAKSKRRIRRGGSRDDLPLENALTIAVSDTNFDLLELNEALERLAEKDQTLAKIVELRFFSGLDVDETAQVLEVSESTVKRDWAMAKAWLHRELTR